MILAEGILVSLHELACMSCGLLLEDMTQKFVIFVSSNIVTVVLMLVFILVL